VLEKRADRGLSGKDRLAKARELVASRKAKIDAGIAAKAAPARSSLREQADAARASKGDRVQRIESLRMRAYDAKRKHSNAALNAGRNQSQYLQTAARARSAQSKADLQHAAGMQSRIANREFDKVGRLQRWTNKLDAAQQPQKPAVDRKAEVMARLEQRRAAMRSPEGQAKIAAQKSRAESRDSVKMSLFAAKPALRDQAAAARTAKGDRTSRLKALAERSMKMAESRATKAGSLSGAAQDRMIDRSMAAAGRYNKLEAARTPYKPASAPAKAATPSRSTPERQAAVQAAKDRLFGNRLDRAFTKLDGPKGKNFQGLDAVRAALPYKADEFNQRLRSQRVQGRYSLDSFEGAAGSISPSLKAASITEGSSRLAYLSRNSAEPYTPRKASLPAIKSGLPTVKSGPPVEKPKPSLKEQAALYREVVKGGSDWARAGRLAERAKKRYDAARRNAGKNADKAKALGQGKGEKYLAKAQKYQAAATANVGRFERLSAMFSAGGKWTQARVVN